MKTGYSVGVEPVAGASAVCTSLRGDLDALCLRAGVAAELPGCDVAGAGVAAVVLDEAPGVAAGLVEEVLALGCVSRTTGPRVEELFVRSFWGFSSHSSTFGTSWEVDKTHGIFHASQWGVVG